MAFASKSEQRMRLSKSYSGGSGMLTSDGYKKAGDMGSNGSRRIAGKFSSGPGAPKLSGKTVGGKGSTLSGMMKGAGFAGGGRQGKASSVPARSTKGTVRMNFAGGQDDVGKGFPMKKTGSTPKVLRGGKAG